MDRKCGTWDEAFQDCLLWDQDFLLPELGLVNLALVVAEGVAEVGKKVDRMAMVDPMPAEVVVTLKNLTRMVLMESLYREATQELHLNPQALELELELRVRHLPLVIMSGRPMVIGIPVKIHRDDSTTMTLTCPKFPQDQGPREGRILSRA